MRSIELFAGAGGLGLGCELGGFRPDAVVEWDRWACDTIRQNAAADYPLVRDWNVLEADVRSVDWQSIITGPVTLVAGGPPCQPFSMGGKARAADDPRDMFPAAAEAIRQLHPKAFILENVKGLTRSTFANYYQYTQLRLAHPEVTAKRGEGWEDHHRRLTAEHTSAASSTLRYTVVPAVVNAADYGIPQQRHRVFLIGFRADMEAEWSFPPPTHSRDALAYTQWVTGDYWDRREVPVRDRLEAPPGAVRRLRREADEGRLLRPWRTVRAALVGLPEPRVAESARYLNHVLQPGARSYPGHTGSYIDLPAKTLKAGDHGVPGGENMLRRADGSLRYFSVRESARLQTFPDRYVLHGSWTEAMRQLGNAVPVRLAEVVAGAVASHLAFADAYPAVVAGFGARERLTA
ncbi:MAG: DNA cytosine methyltransferase [Bifidobacteriaceae bacterium]|jgi:DNA (cytosine-5)-methyltransferase 1|nr:DNA cytosine methyltransferase [Bifidobacteriaceae bacterium]